MGSKYVITIAHPVAPLFSNPTSFPFHDTKHPAITPHTDTPVIDRTFLAESRLILARIIWAFELSLVNKVDVTWPDNRAYLAYEPKALMVNLREKGV